ncbi:MAG: hypothetical protein GY790_07550 [Bacteroidetes bacterium]|nr:hypothetical protein [Bacteroidota bacterium]
MKENAPSNFMPAMDWFDVAFFGNFLSAVTKAKERLNTKKHRLSEENISPRVVNHWVELGLITDDRPEGKGWWMFSISEMIWFGIIVKLRKFGMELSKILKVKEYLEIFSSEEDQSKFPELDFYILYGLNTHQPVKLIVFDSGQAFLARQLDIDLAKQYGFIKDDFISIDINKMVNDGFKEQVSKTDYLNYSFTEIEKEVHQSIFVDDVRSITIQVSGGNEYLISKEHIADSKEEINALVKKAGSHFVETSVHIGNKVVHKLTEKKKMKK